MLTGGVNINHYWLINNYIYRKISILIISESLIQLLCLCLEETDTLMASPGEQTIK